jgi:hypothetical protein
MDPAYSVTTHDEIGVGEIWQVLLGRELFLDNGTHALSISAISSRLPISLTVAASYTFSKKNEMSIFAR